MTVNIYTNIASAALTLFGCASAYKLSKSVVPIQFMRGCQQEDMLIGLIHSKMDYVQPPIGLPRELLDAQLYCMAMLGPLNVHKTYPAFKRENEIISNLEFAPGVIVPRNEELIRAAFSGAVINVDTLFDAINIMHTFDTFCAVESYDLSKISSDLIYYCPGYSHEQCEIAGQKLSLKNIPVLRDGKKAFGSPFCDFNEARIDQDTKEIITVMFGFGSSLDQIDSFSKNLITLQKAQEEHAETKTVRMQIISGYPAVYDLNCIQTPTIICG